jgi:glutamine amidotransferase
MCRLFGFRSSVPSGIHRSLILAQNSLAQQAIAHQHGWGIGIYGPNGPLVVRAITPASECEAFRSAALHAATSTCIAHVRRATVGSIQHTNLHPFTAGPWMMAHNGTIHGFEVLRPRMEAAGFLKKPTGTTDSECFFLFFLQQLVEAGLKLEDPDELLEPILPELLRQSVARLRLWAEEAGVEPPILNILLTNGRLFLAHRGGRELLFSTQKRFCKDAATCTEPNKVCLLSRRPSPKVNHLILASEPIGEEDHWEVLEEGSILMLDSGFKLSFYPS